MNVQLKEYVECCRWLKNMVSTVPNHLIGLVAIVAKIVCIKRWSDME